jgi:hypothetical protein
MDNGRRRRMMYVLVVRETAADFARLAVPHTHWDRRVYSPVTSLWHHFIKSALCEIYIDLCYLSSLLLKSQILAFGIGKYLQKEEGVVGLDYTLFFLRCIDRTRI